MSGVTPGGLSSRRVTRSTEAEKPGTAALVSRQRRAAPNGV